MALALMERSDGGEPQSRVFCEFVVPSGRADHVSPSRPAEPSQAHRPRPVGMAADSRPFPGALIPPRPAARVPGGLGERGTESLGRLLGQLKPRGALRVGEDFQRLLTSGVEDLLASGVWSWRFALCQRSSTSRNASALASSKSWNLACCWLVSRSAARPRGRRRARRRAIAWPAGAGRNRRPSRRRGLPRHRSHRRQAAASRSPFRTRRTDTPGKPFSPAGNGRGIAGRESAGWASSRGSAPAARAGRSPARDKRQRRRALDFQARRLRKSTLPRGVSSCKPSSPIRITAAPRGEVDARVLTRDRLATRTANLPSMVCSSPSDPTHTSSMGSAGARRIRRPRFPPAAPAMPTRRSSILACCRDAGTA